MNFIFEPHDSQRALLEKMTRFTVINCGRRWGKTLIALWHILCALHAGQKVAYFVPTSARFENVWKKLVKALQPVEMIGKCKINLSRHEINFETTGAHCKFWSLEDLNAGRGEDYDLIIIDEAAFCAHLQDSWDKAIRATLLDRRGKCIILSTPDAPEGFFYEMAEFAQKPKNKNWTYFHAPSWTNSLLDQDEIEEIEDTLPEHVFLNEYGAEFMLNVDQAFFYSQKSIIWHETEVVRTEPLYFSFDFNVNPCSLVVGQQVNKYRGRGGGLYIHDEIQIQGTTRELCQALIDHPNNYINNPAGFFITGDNSGNNLDTAVDVLHNNFDVIQYMLNVSDAIFINTRSRNPLHNVSRNTCNTVMHNQLLTINPAAKVLKKEIETAKVDKWGKLKKDREKNKMDLVDATRYLMNAWFPDGTPQIRSFKDFINAAA